MDNKTILHLCADEGSDSKPYLEAGYNVILVKEDDDVRIFVPPKKVYGIIANPPCTHLAGSGARWWKEKGTEALLESLAIVGACLRVVTAANPVFWVLENPVGRLSRYLGKPAAYYQPYEYGDPYTKKTCLWGLFKMPEKGPIVSPTEGSKMHLLPPSNDRAKLRSLCPPGFAYSFFNANR